MTHVFRRALVPALVVLAAVPSAFATTAVSGSMSLTAHATVLDGTDVSTPSTDSWSNVPAGLSIGASATATDSTTSNTASGSGTASWASADAGSVTFSNYGWERSGAGLTDLAEGGPDWSYTFVADQSGTFTMNYEVTASGNTFGLWGWAITLTDSAGLPVSNPNDPTASGTYSGALVAGQTYTASLSNNANLSSQGPFDDSASMNGEFDWSISTSAVPEPGNVSLLLAGLALAGAFARRRVR